MCSHVHGYAWVVDIYKIQLNTSQIPQTTNEPITAGKHPLYILAKATRDSFLPFNQALNRFRNMTGLRNEGVLWQKPWVPIAAMSTNSRPISTALLNLVIYGKCHILCELRAVSVLIYVSKGGRIHKSIKTEPRTGLIPGYTLKHTIPVDIA